MDTESTEDSGKKPVTDRGASTDRGLTREFNTREGRQRDGVLELIGVGIEEIKGKRVLDVGVGGGSEVRQALEIGLDWYGTDILPLVDATSLTGVRKANVEEMQRRFLALQKAYPGRFEAADFCSLRIPFHEDEFDIVLSVGALPGYAQTPREAMISLFNMIFVARERVVVNRGWNSDSNANGEVNLGTDESRFRFPMRDFLESLSEAGIKYTLRKGKADYIIDIDTKGKKSDEINRLRNEK